MTNKIESIGFCNICKSREVLVKPYSVSGYGDKFNHCELCDPDSLLHTNEIKEIRRCTNHIIKLIKAIYDK